jgi:lipoprotein NlpI
VLKPSATLGDTLAPRLRLVTEGLERLSFGLTNESEFGESELVRNNARQPFAPGASVTAPQFRTSDVGRALASQRLFFVTAKRIHGGKYVSSRYELPDFDAILARVEAGCAFDAEALMADVSLRARAEQSLALSASDLKLIRWALGRKYAGAFAAPESRSELGDADRMYLRRYAVENGLPASRYLTAELARKLAAEGAAIAGLSAPASPTAPPPLPSRYRDYFAMCAQASGDEAIAACDYAITSGIYRGVDLGMVYNNRGVEHAQKGDLDRAIADYGEAIRLDPTNVKALHNRGHAWRKRGEYERAIPDFDAVLRLDPNAADALIERGFALADGPGDHQRAILDYNRALRLRLSAHGRNEAYGGRGRAHFCLGSYAAAAPDLVRALQAEADDPYSVLQLFIARVRTGNRAAQKELERNAGRLKENRWPFAAIELMLGRRTPEATMAAARSADQRCEAHYYIGEWQLLHDARADAIAAFRRAAETCKRNFIEYYGALAELKSLGE